MKMMKVFVIKYGTRVVSIDQLTTRTQVSLEDTVKKMERDRDSWILKENSATESIASLTTDNTKLRAQLGHEAFERAGTGEGPGLTQLELALILPRTYSEILM